MSIKINMNKKGHIGISGIDFDTAERLVNTLTQFTPHKSKHIFAITQGVTKKLSRLQEPSGDNVVVGTTLVDRLGHVYIVEAITRNHMSNKLEYKCYCLDRQRSASVELDVITSSCRIKG